MKSVRFHEFGGPDVLRVEDVPDPAPGPGEVLVRVTASALNHVDVDVREGLSRFPVELPHTLGFEPVGRIEALGAGVEGWREGERVHVYLLLTCGRCRFCRSGRENLCVAAGLQSLATGGAYAELMRVPASMLVRVPDGLSDEEAAALPIAFATAWHMLFTRARLRAGETVFIQSVGSGIGSAAVQLAKLAGAFAIGTASSDDKLDRARELGLDVGINYKREDAVAAVMRATGDRGCDVAFEHVGGELFQVSLDVLGKDGRMTIAGGHGGEVVPFDIIPFFRAQKAVLGSSAFTRAEVERSYALAARGRVQAIVHRAFPLAEAAEAMATLERREGFGKIVLVP